jgi:apolipoprotein D and lipocalin family protein
MGSWYEIARIDFRHERGLDNTSAHYSINPDGTIKVVNRGRNMETGLYQESVGKAKVVSLDGSAMLKVSFFGPFYSGYNVLAIDDEYKYALVAGSNYKYLWMLSREKSMPNYIQDKYMEVAEKAGFDTYKLIWINQD